MGSSMQLQVILTDADSIDPQQLGFIAHSQIFQQKLKITCHRQSSSFAENPLASSCSAPLHSKASVGVIIRNLEYVLRMTPPSRTLYLRACDVKVDVEGHPDSFRQQFRKSD